MLTLKTDETDRHEETEKKERQKDSEGEKRKTSIDRLREREGKGGLIEEKNRQTDRHEGKKTTQT